MENVGLLIILLVGTAILFVIAELFGRAKHIGRWWSFFLMWGCFLIPGLIAILLSPSAKKEPAKPSLVLKIVGWVITIHFGLVQTILLLNHVGNPYFTIGLIGAGIILGVYIILLGSGKIINHTPKYYFPEFQLDVPKVKNLFTRTTSTTKDTFYFIVENGQQSEPYTFEQLKGFRLKEDDMVWRNGLEKWMPAKDVHELRNIILYTPPPIQFEQNDIENTESFESTEEILENDKLITPEKQAEEVVMFTKKDYSFFWFWGTILAVVLTIIIVSNMKSDSDSKVQTVPLAPGEYEYNIADAILNNENSTNQEKDSAVVMLENAASAGFVGAYSKLANKYNKEKKYDQAFNYYKKGCENGMDDDCSYLGMYFYKGFFVQKNLDSAMYYSQKSLEMKKKDYLYNNIGIIYFDQKKYKEAFENFTKASEFGFSESFGWLALSFEEGYGVKKNLDSARYYYKRAIEFNPNDSFFKDALKRLNNKKQKTVFRQKQRIKSFNSNEEALESF